MDASKDEKDDFGGLSGTMFGDGVKVCSTSPLEDALLVDPDSCRMCGETLVAPRVLSCLHVFCEACLDKKLIGEGGDSTTPDTSITCPTCNQDTKVGTKKLSALPLDVTKTNVSDVSDTPTLHCTCCTARETATSRCCTCHHLLCANCDSAHHYMRCFESHAVVTLDDLRKDGKRITVHKPLACDVHASENVVFYCVACGAPACGECAKTEHKGHQCDGILDSETRVRKELEDLLTQSDAKIAALNKISGELNDSLEELARERSEARDAINELYRSCRALIEKSRDGALKQLSELHHERELKIMDATEKVGKNASQLEDARKFTSRLLESATVAEMAYLRRAVATQLAKLIGSAPKIDGRYSIGFAGDARELERAANVAFGGFKTESSDVGKETGGSPILGALHFDGSAGGVNGGCNNGPSSLNNNGSSLTNSSPISMPGSMQSSFDGDLGTNLPGFMSAQSPPIRQNVNGAALHQGYSSIAEYNIAALASLAETTAASAATSPTPPFTLAELLTNDTAYKNLASLAKLGLNTGSACPRYQEVMQELVKNLDAVLPNSAANGMMVRAGSPPPLNALMNGFGGVSSSTSPLLSTPDDVLPDPMGAAIVPPPPAVAPQIGAVVPRTNKVSPMQIRCKFGQLGPSKGQFNSPHGFCLGLEEDIIVADTNNHRIQVFDKTGTFKFQFGIPGKDEGQLWYPRKVAVMRSSGKYVVCDRGNERSRMQIFTKNGHFLKKIAIRYIDIVAGLAVSAQGEIIAVDSVSPTVFVISETGELLRWFDCSDYMREPSDIAIHGKEFYVCDFKGHNVVVFNEQGMYLRRIGGELLTNYPNGIDISDAGDVLIGDSHGNRFHVAVFSPDGSLISEFECPYVKVSRCCGLKITSEGYVVTLAKNNHHVLVLNTLYIL